MPATRARLALAFGASAVLAIAACQATAPSPTAPLIQLSVPPASVTPPILSPAATSPAPAASEPVASAPPAVDPARFTTRIINPWFPLIPGWTYTYQGTEDGDKLFETFAVTTDTKVLDSVTCVVISDNLKVNGILEERTSDYYAQDLDGNVWYFGEDTAELDAHGNVTTTAGTWHAGIDGALPGIFMPAQPAIGYSGEQEIYPGTAEDRFVVLGTGGKVMVPYGSFSPVVTTVEWTVLEANVLSEKVYASGIGQVKEFDVRGGSEFLQLTKLVKP